MPIVWAVLAAVGTLAAIVIVGYFAYGSESDGVSATYAVAFPLGLLWGGALSAGVIQLTKLAHPAVRIGGPLGCGFMAGAALLGLVFLFFVGIFPAL